MTDVRAAELIEDGAIMLHKNQSEPSRHGGTIVSGSSRIHTRETKRGPVEVKLWTFTYSLDDDYVGEKYTGTWAQNCIVEDRP